MQDKCLRCALLPTCAISNGPAAAKEAIQSLQLELVKVTGEPLKLAEETEEEAELALAR